MSNGLGMNRTMKLVGCLAVLLTLLIAPCSVQAEDEPKIVRVRATIENATVPATETFDVDLLVRIRSSWHINSQDPGIELLVPTTVRMENPELVELVEVVYPKAKKRRFPYHNKPLPVFESRFTIALKLRMKPSAETGPHSLPGVLRFQACSRRSCLPPEEVPFKLDVIVKK